MTVPADKLQKLREKKKEIDRLLHAAEKLAGGRATGYEGQKDRSRAAQAIQSLRGRDIGPIPPITNIERREKCRTSLRLFCETYNPAAFSLEWSADQLDSLARIEETIWYGALYAFAEPRGDGKTTRTRMAGLYAISYAWRRYVFLIGATAGKARDSLDAIKTFIRYLPLYVADFPEIAHAVRHLSGIANRAGGQTCGGESTMIEWSQDRIILPTVPPPANWPADWPLRSDGMVPTSGIVVGASGLTADGIRGSVLTLTNGEQLRPDLVLPDDPQTDESAASPVQNDTREALMAGAVLGMAGPGKTIACAMPCTVIRPGDFVDRITDRKKHPLWRGVRRGILKSMPTNMDAWEEYFQAYREDAQREPPDFTRSNALYRERREVLDAGAVAAWPERKLPHEVSAVQHAMHLFCRDRRAFFAEYQNKPEEDQPAGEEMLTADEIMGKTNRHAPGIVPAWATKLTAFVDVSKSLLWYGVCAWGDGFEGSVVEYGSWPDQRRPYYTQRDARPSLMDGAMHGEEAAIYGALDALTRRLIERPWKRDNGGDLRLSVCGVDSGKWATEVVYLLCRQSPHAGLLQATKGMGLGAEKEPMTEWRENRGAGEQKGVHWFRRPPSATRPVSLLLYDTYFWKSFVHGRLGVPLGGRGCLSLCDGDHRMLADHLTSERPEAVKSEKSGRRVVVWRQQAHHPDNHLFDVLVGAAALASVQGIGLEHLPAVQAQQLEAVSYAQWQKDAKQRQKQRGR